MPVYILRNGNENIFKVGKTGLKVERRVQGLQTGNPTRLIPFDKIETTEVSACEAFFKRTLSSKKVRDGGGREFYKMDPEAMRDAIAEFRRIWEELKAAREQVAALTKEQSSEVELEPTAEDQYVLSELARNREEQAFLQFECELLESKLKCRIGSSAGLRGIATFKTQVNHKFDEAVFRAKMPDIYEGLLERYYCLDTARWKQDNPTQYREIQTTCYSRTITRPFRRI